MTGPINGSIRSAMRVAACFGIVAALLMIGNWMLERRNAERHTADDIRMLQDAPRRIADGARAIAKRTEERASDLRNRSFEAVSARLEALDAEIPAKREKQRSLAPGLGTLVDKRRMDKVVDWALLGIEADLLRKERDYLGTVQAYLEPGSALATLHQRYLVADSNLKNNQWQQAEIKAKHRFKVHVPGTAPHGDLQELKRQEENLLDAKRRAYDAYELQRSLAAKAKLPAAQLVIGADAVARMVSEYKAPIDDVVQTLQTARDDVAGRFQAVAWTAATIVAGLVLAPLLIRALFYFVLAPLAARRPPILLLPETSGAIGVAGTPTSAGMPRSVVSLSAAVDRDSELLVQPGLLQSSAVDRSKRTQWLLNSAFPLSSLLSGMVALTRVRAERAETVVLSAADDPLCELAPVALPEGSAMVLLPRSLVGVVTPRGRPVRITPHWRLFSLHAWLTLQLRYLVFHGPATLIVKGCRGVRCERASAGRRINQAAMLGFSANLAYSTYRNETFVPYLLAREALFDDVFTGDRGWFLYEETPRMGEAGGVAGRQLEAVLDASLKIFGV